MFELQEFNPFPFFVTIKGNRVNIEVKIKSKKKGIQVVHSSRSYIVLFALGFSMSVISFKTLVFQLMKAKSYVKS